MIPEPATGARPEPGDADCATARIRIGKLPKQGSLVMIRNAGGHCVASRRHRRQRKIQERCQVVASLAGFGHRRQVVVVVFVIVIRQADHHQAADARLPQHECFQSARRTPVAVAKGVHCANMVVSGQSLNDAVVLAEFTGNRGAKAIEGNLAPIATFNAAAARCAERNVPSGRPQGARLATVVITTGHHAAVDVKYEFGSNGPVSRLGAQPAIRSISRS